MDGLPGSEFERGWAAACRLRRDLLNNGRMPCQDPGSVRLMPGELLHADVFLQHDFWYGMDVSYRHSVFAVGGPVLFTAGLVASAIGNGMKRRQAERMAASQWRPYGVNPTLLTDRRVLTFSSNRWFSWPHSDIMEMQPELSENSLIMLCQGLDPLRLSGAWAPWFCVVLAYRLYGPSFLAGHPEFHAMDDLPPPNVVRARVLGTEEQERGSSVRERGV